VRRALTVVGAEAVDERLHTIDVTTGGTAAEIGSLVAKLQAADAPAKRLSTHRPSLDDVFLSLTGTSA
jgi:ABC-2 type transport system ATP-binding protein